MQLQNYIRERSKENESGCWIWQLSKMGRGYGQAWVNKKFQGAHRVSFQAFKGVIPDGLVVCHKCDVKACVNPEHLFLGTYKENTQDMISKGRVAIGGRGKKSKLSASMVKKIPGMRRRGLSFKRIGQELGVCTQTVADVVSGRLWGHATTYREQPIDRTRLTPNHVREIRKLYASGKFSLHDLKKRFGVGYGTVQGVVSGRTWKHVP